MYWTEYLLESYFDDKSYIENKGGTGKLFTKEKTRI
jgi:hypothetical protein